MSKKKIEPVFGYCQQCKEKKEMTQDYCLSTGKVRTLRGECDQGHPMQLIVPKGYKLP